VGVSGGGWESVFALLGGGLKDLVEMRSFSQK